MNRAAIITEYDVRGYAIAYNVIDTDYNSLIIRTSNNRIAEHWCRECDASTSNAKFMIELDDYDPVKRTSE